MSDLRGSSTKKGILKVISVLGYILIAFALFLLVRALIEYGEKNKNTQVNEYAKYKSYNVNETIKLRDGDVCMTINRYSIIEDWLVLNTTFEKKENKYPVRREIRGWYAINENGVKFDNSTSKSRPKAIEDELYSVNLELKEKKTGNMVFYLKESCNELDITVDGTTFKLKGLQFNKDDKIETPKNKDVDLFSIALYLVGYLITFGVSFISIRFSKSLTYGEQIKFIIASMILCLVPVVSIFWMFIQYNIRNKCNGIKIILNGNTELTRNLTEENVREYIKTIRGIKISRKPDGWDGLRNGFILVNEAENISSGTKNELKNLLVEKNVRIHNIGVKESREEIETKKRESGVKGEEALKHNLSWLDKEYKVLYNVQIGQEIDAIVIGTNGVFHLEAKNYGGERGWNISINENGEWVRNYNGNITAVESPSFQVRRHHKVLRETLWKTIDRSEVPLTGVIVMTNKNTTIMGVSNNSVPVIKSETVVEFIEEYKSNETLTEKEIDDIYMSLKKYSIEQ